MTLRNRTRLGRLSRRSGRVSQPTAGCGANQADGIAGTRWAPSNSERTAPVPTGGRLSGNHCGRQPRACQADRGGEQDKVGADTSQPASGGRDRPLLIRTLRSPIHFRVSFAKIHSSRTVPPGA